MTQSNWRFTLIDRNGVSARIGEPEGMANFQLQLTRNLERHGTFNEIQDGTFLFRRDAARMLRLEYLQYGAEGNIRLMIEQMTSAGFKPVFTGQLAFDFYEEGYDMGDYTISVGYDQIGPYVDLVNRFDQAVDLTATTCFDGVTPLASYNFLNFDMQLPSKAILVKDEGLNNTPHELKLDEDDGWYRKTKTGTNYATGFVSGYIVPTFDNTTNNELDTFTPRSTLDFFNHSHANEEAPPIYVNRRDSNNGRKALNCLTNQYRTSFRVKGSFFHAPTTNSGTISLVMNFKKSKTTYSDLSPASGSTTLGPAAGWEIYKGPVTGFNKEFDISFEKTYTMDPEEKLWLTFFLEYTRTSFGNEVPIRLYIDASSFFRSEAVSKCDPSLSRVFMLNESMSRVIEAITNNKLRLYSEYLGRTDSQPFSFPANGCGANRMLTNGLCVRRVIFAGDPNLGVFTSLKDCFASLKATDNLGIGMEGGNVRLEPWHWFYKNDIVLSCKNIPVIKRKIQAGEIYSTFKFGYQKWEAEDTNGLDDLFTKREYRLDVSMLSQKDGASSSTLEQISKFIASGYAIEVTRRKGSDSSDWRYDNDIFMICVEPDGSTYKVEIGNINNASNILDPPSLYNFRITPVRNALRWFNRVIGSYRNVDTGHRIVFGSGDGNYKAGGQLTTLDCTLEAGILMENHDLTLSVFANPDNGKPIMWTERVTFSYPLGSGQYQSLLANPYGLIEYSAPPALKGAGWIDQINYRPNEGMADFTLIPKIQQ